MKNSRVEELRFRFCASTHQVTGLLIRYIKEFPDQQRDIILTSLRARLLPFAVAKYGDEKFSQDEIRDIAAQCIGQLEGFIQAIRIKFGLPNPNNGLGFFPTSSLDSPKDTPSDFQPPDEAEEQLTKVLEDRQSIFG